MKVHVESAGAYYYPDVVVTCSERDLAADAPKNHLEAPQVVVEVLSASTEKVDRREKCMNYRQLPSLGEMLSQRSLDLRLNMDDIYETADVPRTAEKEDC
jgi:Uma2 family endonuclease